MTNAPCDYFRQDKETGFTAPDLSKNCTDAEHIVRARGKRTQLTSVSLAPTKIHDFGPKLVDEEMRKHAGEFAGFSAIAGLAEGTMPNRKR